MQEACDVCIGLSHMNNSGESSSLREFKAGCSALLPGDQEHMLLTSVLAAEGPSVYCLSERSLVPVHFNTDIP